MQNPTKPELEQLVDTFRAVTEEDLTEPLLRKMRTLAGKLDRRWGREDAAGAVTRPILRASMRSIDAFLDLIIPVGAVLIMCFSIGSIFYDGTAHFSAPPPPHVMKAYRKDAAALP